MKALANLEYRATHLFSNVRATTVKNKKLLLPFADFGFLSSVSQRNDRITKTTEKMMYNYE